MKRFDQRVTQLSQATDVVRLPFDERQRARNRVTTEAGEEAGLFIQRGTNLKDGDALRASDGTTLVIRAAEEPLSVVRPATVIDLARVAYHLGNRHVALQIREGSVAYQTDHVLDEMVERMGFEVARELSPFEPEAGAYSREHSHGEGHPHSHSHSHSHSHPHSHGSDGHSHHHDTPVDTGRSLSAGPVMEGQR